jgi:hypothetical protein
MPLGALSAISREAVATCNSARRPISETDNSGSSGVNARRIRAARDSTDSPRHAHTVRRSSECRTNSS